MARSFTTSECKSITKQHKKNLSKLDYIDSQEKTCIMEITEAAMALQDREVTAQLKAIPIEEISREIKGLRVKALKDSGYNTLADVKDKSVRELASIKGVGYDSAWSIHRAAARQVEKTKDTVKIHLSLDDKNPYATRLVIAVAKYLACQSAFEFKDHVEKDYETQIKHAMRDVKPGTGIIRWALASKKKKDDAEKAYRYLSGILANGKYMDGTQEGYKKVKGMPRISANDAWKYFSDNSILFSNIIEKCCPGVIGTSDSHYGLPKDLADEVAKECFFPDGLKCELRRYQEWGVKYILHQKKVLLGDEMGLGKTVQAIATMVSLRNTGATHFFVVCPANVIVNWCREITKHSLLTPIEIHGQGRRRAFNHWLSVGGVGVSTYESLHTLPLGEKYRFSLCVVDEAHYVKNPDAARSQDVYALCSHTDRVLFMTGTALENRVDEMISLISVLQPRIATEVQGYAFLSSAPQFRDKVAPVYYRRKREEVLTELPELIETEEWLTLGRDERNQYEMDVLGKHNAAARRVSWSVGDLGKSCKAARMLELIDEAEDDGRKVIVYSFFLDTIYGITELLGDRATQPITGSVSPLRRQQILDDFESDPDKTVLVAQIQSGGVGLNIQTASVVIICEPQLKPSSENQAISRAYRMGQTRNVLVYRLYCTDTIDERMAQLLEQKQREFDAYADKSVAAQKVSEIDNQTINNIIEEEIERINKSKGSATA